jgi:hypothetical protein
MSKRRYGPSAGLEEIPSLPLFEKIPPTRTGRLLEEALGLTQLESLGAHWFPEGVPADLWEYGQVLNQTFGNTVKAFQENPPDFPAADGVELWVLGVLDFLEFLEIYPEVVLWPVDPVVFGDDPPLPPVSDLVRWVKMATLCFGMPWQWPKRVPGSMALPEPDPVSIAVFEVKPDSRRLDVPAPSDPDLEELVAYGRSCGAVMGLTLADLFGGDLPIWAFRLFREVSPRFAAVVGTGQAPG